MIVPVRASLILLVPFVKIVNSHIYIFLQSTQAFISAPITAVFILGLTLKKISAKSVFISLIIGEFLGVSRFLIEFMNKSGMISNPILIAYAQINYLHFTIFLFLATSLLLIFLSYIVHYGGELNSSKIDFLFGQKNIGTDVTNNVSGIPQVRINIILSGLILVLVLSLWYLFI